MKGPSMFRAIDLTGDTPIRPFMMLWGAVGSKKTTSLAAAFPDYLWLVTNGGALIGANGWNRQQGLPIVESAVGLIDQYDENGKQAVDYFDNWYYLMSRIEGAAAAVRNEFIPPFYTNPDGSKEHLFPGQQIPARKYKGLVISEWTVLAEWIARDGRAPVFGRKSGWDTNDFIRETQGRLKSFHVETGLGVILEGHHAALEMKDGQVARPEGPALPFRKMTWEIFRDLDQCWRIRLEEVDGEPHVMLDTAAIDTTRLALKTRSNGEQLPFTIDLTAEGINLRDVMKRIGLDPDPLPTEK